MNFMEVLGLACLAVIVWFMVVPIDRGMGCSWDLPLGIRGLVWLYRRVRK